jgi:hypothetical protein
MARAAAVQECKAQGKAHHNPAKPAVLELWVVPPCLKLSGSGSGSSSSQAKSTTLAGA